MLLEYPGNIPCKIHVDNIVLYREKLKKTENGTLIGIGSVVRFVDGSTLNTKESPRQIEEIIDKTYNQ